MRYHTSTTQYHCGVDLHARQMYVCVMDSQGNKLLHMNIRDNDFEFFLKKIASWRHDITVCCECLFCWYWFADACQKAGLEFVLAHAVKEFEKELLKITRRCASRDYALLRTVPGIGKVLALTILYEVEDIARFPSVQRFSSYCRLVKGTVASAGKIKGLRGAKLGNPYLRWAFGEAAVLAKRHDEHIAAFCARLEERHTKFKANAIVANKIGRAIYFMLKNKTGFDVAQLTGKPLPVT